MKTIASMGLLIAFYCLPQSLAAQSSPRFEDYAVSLYAGRIQQPKWIRRAATGEWRDNLDKLVEPATINFAGKYFVIAHSCGTSCRYYTMTDLSNGREIEILNDFNSAEPPPKTREGSTYVTDLITRPNSKLIIAQYLIDSSRRDECRERAFIMDGGKLRPITGTKRSCRRY